MDSDNEDLVPINKYEDLLDALKNSVSESGKTNYRISKEADIPLTTVDRMLSGASEANITNLLAAFKSLGIEVYVKPKATK